MFALSTLCSVHRSMMGNCMDLSTSYIPGSIPMGWNKITGPHQPTKEQKVHWTDDVGENQLNLWLKIVFYAKTKAI